MKGHLLSHKQQVSFFYFIQEVNSMEMILFTTGFAVTLKNKNGTKPQFIAFRKDSKCPEPHITQAKARSSFLRLILFT